MARSQLTVVHDGVVAECDWLDYRGLLARSGIDQVLEVAECAGDDIIADVGRLPSSGVVWLLLSDTAGAALTQLIEPLQTRHNAILLTRRRERLSAGELFVPGVVACPPEAGEAVTAAMLHALACHAAMTEAMAIELKLIQLATQGVQAQIGRIDDELRLAAQLQREFLPATLPELDAVDFAVLWRPASYVSGDIYDIRRLDEDHVGLFVADAVGHGVPAALLTMFIQQALTTKLIDPREKRGYRLAEPAEALARINRDLTGSDRPDANTRFATAVYGVLNVRTLELKIARAGHPYPLLYRRDGSTQPLDPDGGLLAVFPEENFEQMRVFLDPGDRLLLHSDGFELAFSHDAPDPADTPSTGPRHIHSNAYLRQFELFRHEPVQQAMRQLEGRIDRAAGSLNQRDDLTLIALAVR